VLKIRRSTHFLRRYVNLCIDNVDCCSQRVTLRSKIFVFHMMISTHGVPYVICTCCFYLCIATFILRISETQVLKWTPLQNLFEILLIAKGAIRLFIGVKKVYEYKPFQNKDMWFKLMNFIFSVSNFLTTHTHKSNCCIHKLDFFWLLSLVEIGSKKAIEIY